MKTNFRKVVSVVCAIAMLLSLCTVSFINTASAAVYGSTEGSYSDLVSYDFDNATGVGHVRYLDKVEYKDGAVHVENNMNGGAFYFAADPNDGATFTENKTAAECELLKLEAGTQYKITFKYKYLAGTTDASVSLFQAKTPDAEISGHGVIAGSADQTLDSGITSANPLTEDETTWRNYEFVFTPASSEHCIGIKPEQPGKDGSKDAFLIDDVVIQKWNEATTIVTDMTAHTDEKYVSYGSSVGADGAIQKITKNEDNSVEFQVGHNILPSTSSFQWCLGRSVIEPDGNVIYLEKGYNYNITVEYKLDAIKSSYIGFGYAKNGDYGSAEIRSLGHKHYEAGYNSGESWEEFTCNIDADTLELDTGKTKAALYLLMIGAGNKGDVNAKFTIKSITINKAEPGYMFVDFNDNGNITHKLAKVGDAIAEVGNNKYNAETLREEFIGWYADPNFTTPVTNYTAEYTTLYAKYPSVVIDFNNTGSYTANRGNGSSSTGKTLDGGYFEFNNAANTMGIMIPSYDANISDATTAAFYQFKHGEQYKITFVYTDCDKAATPTLTTADYAGGAGSRKIDQSVKWTTFVVTSGESKTATAEFTFNKGDFELYGLDIRSCGGAVIKFDKIIITQVTGMDQYKLGSVTFVDGGKTVATYTETDKFVCAPTPNTPEGKLFIGWYDASYNAYKGATKSAASAPVSFAKVAKGVNVTYEARYIDAAETVIDFDNYKDRTSTIWSNSEKKYINVVWTEYPASSAGDRSKNVKVTDAGDGDYYLETTHVGLNKFKSSLFNAEGKKFVVYEGVEYEVAIDYEVNTNATDYAVEGSFIGLTRNYIDSFQPQTVKFADGTTNFEVLATAEKARHTVTKSFTVSDIHVAYDGSVEGGAEARQTELSLLLYGGAVKVYSVTITPKRYTSVFTPEYDATKGDVTFSINDDGSVIVGAKPKEGYVLAANGVKVVRTFKSFVKVNNDKDVKVTDGPSYGYALNTSDGKNFMFKLSDLSADVLRTASLKVDFVAASATDNAAFVGASVRNPEGTVSAGIRFRARISDATVKAANKIEFVVVPETELPGSGLVKDYTGAMAVTGVAYEKDGVNIVYDASIDGFTDYQVCVTGLTETTMAWKLAAAVKITYADNTVEYFQITNNQSYNGLSK